MLQHHVPTAKLAERVIILGAAGFVGKNLVDQLDEEKVNSLPVTSKDIDLCQPESVNQLQDISNEGDVLVIVSALTPDKGRGIDTFMQNLKMGQHLAAYLENCTCSQVVYISSDAVYEDEANPVKETSCCNPSSFHGLMHLAREQMIKFALNQTEIPLLCLRPCALYGVADTHNSYGPNRFLRTALEEGNITLFGIGEEKRDHVYIKDLSRLIGLGISHRSEGTLNVATGKAIPFSDVAQSIAGLIGPSIEVVGLPRTNPITHRHFDITAILKAFPSFSFTPFEVGISEVVKDSQH